MKVSGFANELAGIDTIKSAIRRGRAFENLLSKVFETNGYEVARNSKRFVTGRECDLVATFRVRTLLIEAKWHSKPLDISVLDHLQARLRRAPRGTIGCLISRSDLSKQLINKIRALRSPLVVFQCKELAECVDTRSLHSAIETKIATFNSKREVATAPSVSPTLISPFAIVERLNPRITHQQIYIDTTCPDLHFPWHWEEHRKTQLRLTPTISELKYLSRAIRIAEQDLQASSAGSFSIYGLGGSWHGIGSHNLLNALQDSRRRADATRIHHSEDFRYTTEFWGGTFQIVGRHSNQRPTHIDSTEVSLSLEGIPLDLAPFQRLGDALGARRACFLEQERERHPRRFVRERVKLDVLQLILASDEAEPLVVGLIARNPIRFKKTRRIIEELGIPNSDKIVCDIKDHHPLSSTPDYYYLTDVFPEHILERDALRIRATWNEMTNRPPISFRNLKTTKKSKRRIA